MEKKEEEDGRGGRRKWGEVFKWLCDLVSYRLVRIEGEGSL